MFFLKSCFVFHSEAFFCFSCLNPVFLSCYSLLESCFVLLFESCFCLVWILFCYPRLFLLSCLNIFCNSCFSLCLFFLFLFHNYILFLWYISLIPLNSQSVFIVSLLWTDFTFIIVNFVLLLLGRFLHILNYIWEVVVCTFFYLFSICLIYTKLPNMSKLFLASWRIICIQLFSH